MRAVKDSPVTRLVRNHLHTSGREGDKIRTSEIMKRAVSGKGSSRTILLARRGPTMKRWSLNARTEEQSGCSP